MKILQIITSLRVGGAEKLVADMSPLFVQRGHQVDVLVFDGMETPFMKLLTNKGIRVIRFNQGGSMYHPKYIWKLRKIISQYDIVHTHNTSCQYYTALAKRIGGVTKTSLITTEHNTTNRRRTIPGFKKLDQWMYKQYDALVSISEQATENLSAFIGREYKIHTIFNGIDLKSFVGASLLESDSLLKKTTHQIVLCMVAGFRQQKDQDTLIRALGHLPENYHLWLIGDGERRETCDNLVHHLGLDARVVFAGIRTDIPQILKTADIIVMSSHWEGLSLSSIEGMSVGKPFVASDVDGLHEIVVGNGLLFPHKDDKALAEIIRKLAENPEYAQKIAEKCYQKAIQYDLSKTVDAYLKVYQEVLS